MELAEVKATNKYNKEFIVKLSQFLSNDLVVSYISKKNNHFNYSTYDVSIRLEKKGYKPLRLPILFTNGKLTRFNNKFLQERLDVICKDSKNTMVQEFKCGYDKVFSKENLMISLSESLTKKDESKPKISRGKV